MVAALMPVAEAKALFYQFAVWVSEGMAGKDYPVLSTAFVWKWRYMSLLYGC